MLYEFCNFAEALYVIQVERLGSDVRCAKYGEETEFSN